MLAPKEGEEIKRKEELKWSGGDTETEKSFKGQRSRIWGGEETGMKWEQEYEGKNQILYSIISNQNVNNPFISEVFI